MGSIAKLDAGIRISIDRGGTFTDYVASIPGQDDILVKLLSVDPNNYPDAPVEAIRRVLEKATGKCYPKGEKISLQGVSNSLKDLLHIGNQSRPKLFDLAINKPDVLYSKVVEVSERVTLKACTESKTPTVINQSEDSSFVTGITGEVVRISEPLEVESARASLQELYDDGYRLIAVYLMDSYTFQDHELAIGKLAADVEFTQISLSAELVPTIKIVPHGNSSTADAYLTPEIKRYIAGFELELSCLSGLRAILSGPASGVVGYAKKFYDEIEKTPVIGFDMGGTSTDVSRYAGELEQIFETTTAGVTVQSPQLDINMVAAGGGSILSWQSGMFKVGPESALAHLGPACYQKGGPLTVTDASLVLGRLRPEFFLKIFGPNEDQPLDIDINRKLFRELTDVINEEIEIKFTLEEVAAGFLDVANEALCRPIRTLTEARGHDTGIHNLASFGGAGGQHACDISKVLGISRVLIHKYSSVLSAYGIALADIVHEERSPSAFLYTVENLPKFAVELDKLQEKSVEALLEQRVPKTRIISNRYLNMRFQGSDTPLMVQETSSTDCLSAFSDADQK
ncbi:hypothetical protein G7Y89_g15438 [Cudoniella acicularis]|uniref:5-oxoprolinase n=1 Tax=Cudoniella acicularis TaxID=354080 RepID=A0A8H4QNZ8_9HELO|nr:hypothetical protein G7Y89_g15438 [Cudoniella acicularis]